MTSIKFKLFVEAFAPVAIKLLKWIGIAMAFVVVITVGTIVKVLAGSMKLR
jgi:hypothetical protein